MPCQAGLRSEHTLWTSPREDGHHHGRHLCILLPAISTMTVVCKSYREVADQPKRWRMLSHHALPRRPCVLQTIVPAFAEGPQTHLAVHVIGGRARLLAFARKKGSSQEGKLRMDSHAACVKTNTTPQGL